MPAPAVYIVAVVGGVAAAIAFKQFVYDPHLAPRIRAWREVRLAQHQRRRQRREPVPVSTNSGIDVNSNGFSRRDDGSDSNRRSPDASVELDTLVFNEVDQWRNIPTSSTLRHRHPAGVIDESNLPLPYPLIAPSLTSSAPRVASPSSTYTLGSPPELGSSSPPGSCASLSPSIPPFPVINQTLSAFDIEINASIYQTPPTHAADLSPSIVSRQIAVVSPFSDDLELSRTQSHRSEMDDVLSVHSGLSSPVASTIDSVTDDDDDSSDHSLRGSDDSWADIVHDHSLH